MELASSRVLALVGPVADLSVDRICAVLEEAAASSPTAHITLWPTTDHRRWNYRSRDWRQLVSVRPDLDTGDLSRLLIEVRHRPGVRAPLEVLICGDYLVVDYSHGLGDGTLGALLPAVLLGYDAGATALSARLPRWAPVPALLRHFALRPRRVGQLMRMRRSGPPAHAVHPTRCITDWESARRSVTAYMDAGAVAELRAWTSVHCPDATNAAVTLTLLTAALRSAGVPLDEEITVLVDCRRYLGPENRGRHGNFAVGIPIHAPPGCAPDSIATQLRAAIESGRPLARLCVAELKARLDRSGPPRRTRHVDVGDRVRLTVSDLGRLTLFDHVRWRSGGAPPQAIAYVEPDGPDAIDLEVAELLGARTFTASFCAKMVDPTVLETAFRRMCEDPVGILRAENPPRLRPVPVPRSRAPLRRHAAAR
ncbi:hypothetical protein [Mycolicibacterium thermoresistibile]